MGVDLMNRAAGPLTGRDGVLARRKDVPSLQTYSDHSIDKHARLREQSRGRGTGTLSLSALENRYAALASGCVVRFLSLVLLSVAGNALAIGTGHRNARSSRL